MTDSTSVQAALATLTAAGWDCLEPNEGGKFGGVSVLNTLVVAPPLRNGNRVVLLGDSLTAQGAGTAATPSWAEHAWFVHLNRMAGGRLLFVANNALGGRTTADVLANLATDCHAIDADWAFLFIGVNDWQGSIALQTTMDNITAICSQIVATGKRVGLVIPGPRSWSLPTDNAKALLQFSCTQWLRRFASYTKGVYLLGDAHAALIDPASASGAWLTANNRAAEGAAPFIHTNNLGAHYVAMSCLPQVKALFPPVQVLPDSTLRNNTYDPREVMDDPLQVAGTKVPGAGGTSGLIPTGWDFNGSPAGGTVAAAVVANADGFGNDVELTITASGAGGLTIYTGLPAGTRLNAFNAADYQILCGGWSKIVSDGSGIVIRSRWVMIPNGGPFAGIDCLTTGTNPKPITPQIGIECVDVSSLRRVSAGTVFPSWVRMQIQVDWAAAGTAVVRCGRPFLRVIQPTI